MEAEAETEARAYPQNEARGDSTISETWQRCSSGDPADFRRTQNCTLSLSPASSFCLRPPAVRGALLFCALVFISDVPACCGYVHPDLTVRASFQPCLSSPSNPSTRPSPGLVSCPLFVQGDRTARGGTHSPNLCSVTPFLKFRRIESPFFFSRHLTCHLFFYHHALEDDPARGSSYSSSSLPVLWW